MVNLRPRNSRAPCYRRWVLAVSEARSLRKSTSRAYVVVDVEGDKSTRAINLALANVGMSHAENVTVTFDPPLEAASPGILHEATAAIWRQPLIPPGKRIRTVLDNGPDHLDANLPMEYRVDVAYDSPATGERKIKHTYRLDLNASVYAIRLWDRVDQDTPKQTRALESIATSMKAILDR